MHSSNPLVREEQSGVVPKISFVLTIERGRFFLGHVGHVAWLAAGVLSRVSARNEQQTRMTGWQLAARWSVAAGVVAAARPQEFLTRMVPKREIE